jgi:hypothetical protein
MRFANNTTGSLFLGCVCETFPSPALWRSRSQSRWLPAFRVMQPLPCRRWRIRRATSSCSASTNVALHRRLEADLPPEIVTADPERLFAPRTALAREIRKARAAARQGDIFTPAVAEYFRGLITEALRVGRVENFLERIEEENSVRVIPTVNGDYPAGASISPMPACLLAALPPLPKELQYRFLSRDLILWDLHAGLIVDFVPRALVETTMPPCP